MRYKIFNRERRFFLEKFYSYCSVILYINSGVNFVLERLLDAQYEVTLREYLRAGYGTDLSDEQVGLYETYGGTPWLFRCFKSENWRSFFASSVSAGSVPFSLSSSPETVPEGPPVGRKFQG